MLEQVKTKKKSSLFSHPMDEYLVARITEWQGYDMALKEKTIMDNRKNYELSKGKFGSIFTKESLYSPTYLNYGIALVLNGVFIKPAMKWSGVSYLLICLLPYSLDVFSNGISSEGVV